MDIKNIKKYYNEAPTKKLLELVNNLHELRAEALPLLKQELLERNLLIAFKKVELFESNSFSQQSNSKINYTILKQEINDRLNNGESIDTIKSDIKKRIGINEYLKFLEELTLPDGLTDDQFIFAVANTMQLKKLDLEREEIAAYLKEQNLSDTGINKIIHRSETDKDTLIREANQTLKKRNKNDLNYGPIIIILGLIVIIICIIYENHHYALGIGIIVIGVRKVLRGSRLKNKTIETDYELTKPEKEIK